ncbi:hypothetical protein Dimus_013024, partial [Dionaea muscipula]
MKFFCPESFSTNLVQDCKDNAALCTLLRLLNRPSIFGNKTRSILTTTSHLFPFSMLLYFRCGLQDKRSQSPIKR